MQPRPIDPQRDLPAVATLLGKTRAAGGIWHPGGIQWWLRELAGGREDFAAWLWFDGDDAIAFVMRDGNEAIAESYGGPAREELVSWAETRLRAAGETEITTTAIERSPLAARLTELGYAQTGAGFDLMADTDAEPPRPTLPDGFRFASLNDVDDETFVAGHRAAWSDKRPSPYGRERHDAVKRMPQFRPALVTIALAPDGTMASYCIGWLDDRTQTLEIEPLGTHRYYRRLHLATAVVREVTHRAWANGAKQVLVWNNPKTNAPAFGLYTGAGMSPRSRIAELTLDLTNTNVVKQA